MRIITIALAIMFVMSFSICWAEEGSLDKAYSLYYKGDKDAAIEMMEEYIETNPEPSAYYFLGYAYYEMQDMQKASEYFNKAYVKKPFYSPMSEDN